jgi:hypothetical protein
MITATRIKVEKLRTVEKLQLCRYTFPTVLGSTTSDIIRMDVDNREGEIKGFRVSCASTLFDVHVYAKSTTVLNSVDEILRVINMDTYYQEMDLGIFYSNDDVPESDNLYLVLEEKSGSPTGTVTVEFILSVMDNVQEAVEGFTYP